MTVTENVVVKKTVSMIASFLNSEAAGGLILMATAAAALVVANSPLAHLYFDALHAHVGGLSVLHWINDAFMALFFLMVGLEIKREVLTGELSTWSKRALPGFAALGGVIVPAMVYVAVNRDSAATLRGWAIPTATDIAFALGVLTLLGTRVPVGLKIFLTALAIIDDLLAVIVIAIFYTSDLSPLMLAGAGIGLLCLFAVNRARVKALWPYLLLGVVIWVFIYKSGIHATLAGVALALFIPLHTHKDGDDHHSPLVRLEHALHRPVAFCVVPLFGFANAGVALGGLSVAQVLEPVPIGVALGLALGKQAGVFLATLAVVKSGLAPLPKGAGWGQMYGLALLTGIGFTMSLFIGLLAFSAHPAEQDLVKVGVLIGSLVSGVAGFVVLRCLPNRPPAGWVLQLLTTGGGRRKRLAQHQPMARSGAIAGPVID